MSLSSAAFASALCGAKAFEGVGNLDPHRKSKGNPSEELEN
jgi:hypothetical protein